MIETEPAEIIYDGPWHYKGFHACRSVCYLRIYQSKREGEPKPAVAIFTEIEANPGSSVTNRIEILATSAWEFLQKPEIPPIVVEHYPNRGVHNPHNGRWQFPEHFDFVEFYRRPDGSFEKPKWRRTSRLTIEELIGHLLMSVS